MCGLESGDRSSGVDVSPDSNTGLVPASAWIVRRALERRRFRLQCNSASALQVHAYEPQTFILRQSPCADFEANFIYLLIGSDKALLIDTGAVADPKAMPLAKTILELLPDKDHKKLPLLVAHTHRHLDHRAGDPQFASLPSVQVVPIDLEGVRAFSVSLTGPTELLISIWVAELWT